MDGVHDMGGMHGFGAVDTAAADSGHEGWESRLQAVAFMAGAITRAGIEEIEPVAYLDSTYHERWIVCAEGRAVGKGMTDEATLERWREVFAADATAQPPRREDPANVAAVQAMLDKSFSLAPAESPRFAVGDRVRVKRMRPEPHHRSPRYIRGAVGVVEKVAAQDYLPGTRYSENLTEPVYTVRFNSVDLWGDRTEQGEPPYDLFIDQWETYLEPHGAEPEGDPTTLEAADG
ncbi:MAG: nitrile hydratase subunit beta [Actinomycetia bacterium]|nr:nitrile hydratase subunit beta [Actinomycetes bacterium]